MANTIDWNQLLLKSFMDKQYFTKTKIVYDLIQ